MLDKKVLDNDDSQIYVVFITNKEKKAEIKYQKAGSPLNQGLVIWDYHVILIHYLPFNEDKTKIRSYVYDFDTTLDFPIDFGTYYNKAFDFPKKRPLYFRVIDYKTYLEYFASNRSHMISSFKNIKGKMYPIYLSSPPSYPCIINRTNETNNIELYWDLDNNDKKYGQIMSQEEFYIFFTKIH